MGDGGDVDGAAHGSDGDGDERRQRLDGDERRRGRRKNSAAVRLCTRGLPSSGENGEGQGGARFI